MIRVLLGLIGVLTLALTLAAPAASETLKIGAYSQAASSERANAGGSVSVSDRRPGHRETTASNGSPGGRSGGEGGSSGRTEPTFPSISSSSPQYRNPHPFGPSSFWYTAEGHQCVYVPTSNGACFNLVQPEAGQPAQPPINPSVIAAGLASQMTLQAGGIVASPPARTAGLTGASSWFWLEPAPGGQSLSSSLRGEHVKVDAAPSAVRWDFGDGSSISAGPGVPYRPEAAPSGSVRHVYQTRCLPGDRGHDPYVASSCGTSGYHVQAIVEWGVSYRASGPVAAGGSLPSRATETSTAYPVSEVRAFLTGASGR
jgi:hypothetical protein